MDANDGIPEGSEDTTMLVQMEKEIRVIWAMSFVTKLLPVGAHNRQGQGWQASLSVFRCKEHGSCKKKQEPPVQVSSRHPTLLARHPTLLVRHPTLLFIAKTKVTRDLTDSHVQTFCPYYMRTRGLTTYAQLFPH